VPEQNVIFWASIVILLIIVWLAAGWRRAHVRAETLLRDRVWAQSHAWSCRCGRVSIDADGVVPDGRGMLHGARACQPDLQALS